MSGPPGEGREATRRSSGPQGCITDLTESRAELVRAEGVSRAAVTQALNRLGEGASPTFR